MTNLNIICELMVNYVPLTIHDHDTCTVNFAEIIGISIDKTAYFFRKLQQFGKIFDITSTYGNRLPQENKDIQTYQAVWLFFLLCDVF